MSWKQLSDKAKQQRELERVQHEKILSNRRTLNAYSDGMWIAVRQGVEDATGQLSKEMEEVTPDFIIFHGRGHHNQFKVKIRTLETKSEYSPGTWTLSVEGYGFKSCYRLSVIAENVVVWIDERHEQYTSEQVAEAIVQRAFEASELQRRRTG